MAVSPIYYSKGYHTKLIQCLVQCLSDTCLIQWSPYKTPNTRYEPQTDLNASKTYLSLCLGHGLYFLNS